MKTEYRYMIFTKYTDMFGDAYWRCLNRKNSKLLLAKVVWNDNWRCWELQPEPQCCFTVDCLQDIIHFIGQLAKEKG